MKTKPATAVLYLRLSQDRTGEAAGIDRQRADCQALAERQGWQVVGEYVDNGKSAYSGRPRPAFEQLLTDAAAGAFHVLIVWASDRLYRQMKDLTRITSDLAPHVRIASVMGGGEVDLSTAEGIMRAQMLGSVAEFESRRKGERVKRAAEQRAGTGAFSGGIRPFGYEADGVTVRESEAAAVRRVYADVLAGVSLREITRRLAEAGVTTSTGKPWVAQHLRGALVSPRFAGIATYRGAEVGEAAWPAIVDEPTYRAAVRVLTDPSRRTTPGPAPKHLLSGIAVCGREDCGKPCRATSSGRRVPRVRYRCPRGHVIREKEALDRYVEELTVALLEREQVRPAPPHTTSDESAVLRGRLDDLAAAFAVGEITREQLATASRSLRAQLDRAETRAAASTRADVLTAVTGPDAAAMWDRLPLERRRAVLREIWGTIRLKPMPTGRRGVNPEGVEMVPAWATT